MIQYNGPTPTRRGMRFLDAAGLLADAGVDGKSRHTHFQDKLFASNLCPVECVASRQAESWTEMQCSGRPLSLVILIWKPPVSIRGWRLRDRLFPANCWRIVSTDRPPPSC